MEPRRFKAILLPLCAACLLLASWMLFHSLTGVRLAGCGAGSACDSVTGGPWGYIFGGVPVSLPAAVAYLLLIICISFWGSDPSLDRLLRVLLPLLGGCLAGAALWFCGLQLLVLHAFCKYCTLLHVLGCAVAAIILFGLPRPSCHPRPPGSPETASFRGGLDRGSPFLWFAAGLAAAALFAVVQVRTRPDAIYDSGRTEALLPAFSEGDLPVLETGWPVAAGHDDSLAADPDKDSHARPDRASLTLLFDFQCNHCRRLHRILPELLERADGQFRVFLCPVPLSSACNPYIPTGAVDRFAGSCPLTRYAMAVWYARPEAYAAYWDYLLGDGDERAQVSPDEALQRAQELLGDSLGDALADPRIDACLRKAEELFGRTSSASTGGVPRLILGQRWLVPETDDADELLQLIRTELSLPY